MNFYLKLGFILSGIAILLLLVFVSRSNKEEPKVVQENLIPLSTSLHKIRNEIEAGDFLVARQKLVDESRKTLPKEAQEQISFLLGLSYLKEAEGKPVNAIYPYYKLAFSYFSHVPMEEKKFDQERQMIIQNIQALMPKVIESQSLTDLDFFVSLLEDLNAVKELKQVSYSLAQLLEGQIDKNNDAQVPKLAYIISPILPSGDIRNALVKKLEAKLVSGLKEGQLAGLENYWKGAKLLSRHPEEMSKNIAEQTQTQILNHIASDDQSLTITTPYIKFLGSVEEDPQKRLELVTKLLIISQDYWQQEGQELKATSLMQNAKFLTPHQYETLFQTGVKDLLTNAYLQALQENKIGKLSYIYMAAKELNVPLGIMQDKKNLPHHLENAQALFEQQNFTEAKSRADWVLLLEPQNLQALRIAGLVEYMQANYKKAKKLLEQILNPSSEVLEALAVSQILTGEQEKGVQNLKKVERDHPLYPNTYLRLGIGKLIQNDPKAALDWLSKINNPDSEACAVLAYAYYSIQDWKNAFKFYQLTKPPYKDLNGLKAIAIQSLVSLGQVDEAELMLKSWVKGPEQPQGSLFPVAFRIFKEKLLDQLDINYIAALFYLNVKKQDQLALRYLNKIAHPSLKIILQRGQVYINLHQYEDALRDLKQAVAQKKDPVVRDQAMLLLAEVYHNLHDSLDAYSWFHSYFPLVKENPEQLRAYAHVLYQVRRFDLAKEAYLNLQRQKSLSPDEQIALVACFVNTNDFKEGADKAKLLLKNEPPLPKVNQLELARLLIIMGKDFIDVTELLREEWKEVSTLSDKESQALMRLLLLFGAYNEASILANTYAFEWEKSVSGLLLLAEFNERLSLLDSMIKLAKQAVELQPSNLEARDYWINHQIDPKISKKQAAQFQEELKTTQNTLSVSVAYAQATIRWLILENYRQSSSPIELSVALQEVINIFESLTKQYDLPLIYHIYGTALFLDEKQKEAMEIFKKALKLDPSYSQAAMYAALVQGNMRDFRHGRQLLEQSLKFEPDNARAWFLLASFNMHLDNLEEAILNLSKAVMFSPNDTQSYVLIGQIYLSIKDPESALFAFERAVKLNPKNEKILALVLRSLYDPAFDIVLDNKDKLDEQKEKIFQELYKLDPKLAEKLKTELILKSSQE